MADLWDSTVITECSEETVVLVISHLEFAHANVTQVEHETNLLSQLILTEYKY